MRVILLCLLLCACAREAKAPAGDEQAVIAKAEADVAAAQEQADTAAATTLLAQ